MEPTNYDTFGSILRIFSSEEHIDLLKVISNDGRSKQHPTPELLSYKFDLSRRDLNSRIEIMMTTITIGISLPG